MIRATEVRLIDHEGQQVGVVPIAQAQQMAREKELDLVEISASANPPVCKIMDYGKFIFQQKKKAGEAKKKQKVIVVKEVQFRPRIDEHDFDFKRNHVLRFLKDGDKVKASIRFRGRERTTTAQIELPAGERHNISQSRRIGERSEVPRAVILLEPRHCRSLIFRQIALRIDRRLPAFRRS